MHVEEAHNLNLESNLIGVSCLPIGGVVASAPCIVFINAGLLHRVGPNRMNTTLARVLAGRGFPSIRVDISGLGDSMTSAYAIDNNELVSNDLSEAMNFMHQQYGCKRFILVGLCSGAHDTFRKAKQDSRVVGLLNIDGAGYRTRRFMLNHFFIHLLRRAFNLARWIRLYHRYVYLRSMKTQSPTDDSQAIAGSEVESNENLRPQQREGIMTMLAFTDMTREQSGAAIQALSSRGVKMHFLFTGGVSGYYNYHSQFDDMFKEFDFGDSVSYSYFPVTDHLSMLQRHRDEVYDEIVNWVDDNFTEQSPVALDATCDLKAAVG